MLVVSRGFWLAHGFRENRKCVAGSCLTAREASAAMALVTAATEGECHIIEKGSNYSSNSLLTGFAGSPPAVQLGVEVLPGAHVQARRDRRQRQRRLPAQPRGQGQLFRLALGAVFQVAFGPAPALQFLGDAPG
jgi:hypothetical protein